MKIKQSNTKPPRVRYKALGRCIYCNASDSADNPLSDEHIMPLALGGDNYIVSRASCMKCAETTSKFERVCAQDIFGVVRTVLNAPTRRPHKRAKSLPILVSENGEEVRRHVPVDRYPYINLILPQLPLPTAMNLTPPSGEPLMMLRFMNVIRIARGSLSTPEAPASTLSVFQFPPFLQLLAKIAHAYAVAELGLESHTWFLPPLIVSSPRDFEKNLPAFTRYIGGVEDLNPTIPQSFLPEGLSKLPQVCHWFRCVNVRGGSGESFLGVLIQLFYDFAPRYLVIVGERQAPCGKKGI